MIDAATKQRLDARALAVADDSARIPDAVSAALLERRAQTVRAYLYDPGAEPVGAAGMVQALERELARVLAIYSLAPTVAVAGGSTRPKPGTSGNVNGSTGPVQGATLPATTKTPEGSAAPPTLTQRARNFWSAKTDAERRNLTIAGVVIVAGAAYILWPRT